MSTGKQFIKKTIYDPGVFPDAEVARMASEATARAVFPPGDRTVLVIVDGRKFTVTRNIQTGVVQNAFITE